MAVCKRLLAALCALAGLALVSGCSQRARATDYYVSTIGNDSSGAGSITNPWATIAHASSYAKPGTTIHVAAGIYTGSFDTYASGTPSAYITYQATTSDFSAPVTCAHIAANQGNLDQCVRLIGTYSDTWDNYGDYVSIQGFDVTGPGVNGIYTQGNATAIIGNHVHDMLPGTCNSDGGSGINLNGANAKVIGNFVHNIGPFPSACNWVQGIYFLQAGGYAQNNISFANSGFGIQLWHWPSHIALVNNTVFNNASGGIVLGTDYSNFTVDYVLVSNNVVVNNRGVGIQEQGESQSSTGIHNVYTHNLVEGNSDGAYSLQNGLSPTSTVDGDPQFVNYTGTSEGNYHLLWGSPAINQASASEAPSTDFDGNIRPQNGGYDIGAYQFTDR
jgi:hypothetical protein